MTTLDNKAVLQDLSKRLQAHRNGVLAFYRAAGIEEEIPTLTGLATLYQLDRNAYNKLLEFLYADEIKAAQANADGTTSTTETEKSDNTKQIIGGISAALSVVSAFLSGYATTGSSTTNTATTATTEEKEETNYIPYILGGVALIFIILIVFVTLKKNNK